MSRRMSVTLDSQDEQALIAFSDASSLEHAALTAWAADQGVEPDRLASEASVVRALLRAGAQALTERALDEGYAALAAAITPKDAAETRAARKRYVARTESRAGA